ncbi:hypothetical protein Acy02nite_50270 [Actinoplanes cyaneus]|uniref:Gram-positive cocci surface proteins LPxTG domain-containing protein n=1 Tax=Actinoplanes cyaneus TaxID=52696 RepID=A0A919MDG9_9ACTN|nr:TIGR03773 family transporter-associated surface protein [Actinoplanes cyaneus]MCW2141084.1 putative ABC transporter-associated repeat protein [Actinoplanes cyaneus]GID67146.1 hypothetical protein Acy02nite_50270 [Actinoplanes cyaneus]
MTPRKRRGLRTAAATASLIATLPASAPAAARPQSPQVAGADLIALSVDSGKLLLNFREHGQAEDTDPAQLRFTAAAQPAGTVPDDPAYAFLGPPGTTVWSLAGGEGLPAIDTTAVAGDVALELVSADGPGSFAAYTLSNWGRPALLLDSDSRTSTPVPAGRRTGGLVWMFDSPGEYRLTLRATVRTGSTTTQDEATYTVTVPGAGTTAPAAATPALTAPTAPAAAAKQAAAATPTGQPSHATAAAKALSTTAASTTAAGRKVISEGHVDMGPQLSGSTLTIRLKDDSTTPATWRDLADVTLKVSDKAKIAVPSGSGYAFLGAAGDQVYLLPQSQQAGIVWPGWNTQHESIISGTKGNVTWRLRKVDGPGAVKLFLTGSFGAPEVVFDSARSLPQQLSIPPNTHAHGNWAFTEAGTYRLAVEMTATTTAGKTVSDTRTLTFAVGDATGTGGGTTAGPSATAGGGGDNTGSTTGTTTGSAGGKLPQTGTDILSIATGGLLLAAGGAFLIVVTRRRRGEQHHAST